MKLICAWCKVVLLTGKVPASHGICVFCKLKLEGDTKSRGQANVVTLPAMQLNVHQNGPAAILS
jgi:hypothetical protein